MPAIWSARFVVSHCRRWTLKAGRVRRKFGGVRFEGSMRGSWEWISPWGSRPPDFQSPAARALVDPHGVMPLGVAPNSARLETGSHRLVSHRQVGVEPRSRHVQRNVLWQHPLFGFHVHWQEKTPLATKRKLKTCADEVTKLIAGC